MRDMTTSNKKKNGRSIWLSDTCKQKYVREKTNPVSLSLSSSLSHSAEKGHFPLNVLVFGTQLECECRNIFLCAIPSVGWLACRYVHLFPLVVYFFAMKMNPRTSARKFIARDMFWQLTKSHVPKISVNCSHTYAVAYYAPHAQYTIYKARWTTTAKNGRSIHQQQKNRKWRKKVPFLLVEPPKLYRYIILIVYKLPIQWSFPRQIDIMPGRSTYQQQKKYHQKNKEKRARKYPEPLKKDFEWYFIHFHSFFSCFSCTIQVHIDWMQRGVFFLHCSAIVVVRRVLYTLRVLIFQCTPKREPAHYNAIHKHTLNVDIFNWLA